MNTPKVEELEHNAESILLLILIILMEILIFYLMTVTPKVGR